MNWLAVHVSCVSPTNNSQTASEIPSSNLVPTSSWGQYGELLRPLSHDQSCPAFVFVIGCSHCAIHVIVKLLMRK